MDQSSHGYAYREGASDVERTLKTVTAGVIDSQSGLAEVSFWSMSRVFRIIIQLCMVGCQIK